MRAVDTNVLVRLITRDDARQAALAQPWEPATKNGVPYGYTVSYKYGFTEEDK